MTIFSGGKSTAINSPRHLPLRRARARKNQGPSLRLASFAESPESLAVGETDTESLDPGQEKINSYWAPGLEAGPVHRVNVVQTIDANNGNPALVLNAEQDFSVDAPQFSLPEGSVHSVYPPSGYTEEHRILPHVVLTDPHLPWERIGDPQNSQRTTLDRNRVPWLVVFSFSQDELRLPPEDLDGDQSIFKETSDGLVKPVKQSSTMAINMTVEDLWKTTNIATPTVSDLGPASMKDARGDFIFIKSDLFISLFSTFDANGVRQVPSNPNTTQYQYLSHVRNINSTGMAFAGVEDTAVFSIVVGNRAGPISNALPATMCVHLVSIEGVEDMTLPISSPYVAVCSLYSWNYTVRPPGMRSVFDTLESIGASLDVLRPPENLVTPLKSGNQVQQRVASRLVDGFSLVRYRVQTGESTIALYRGPFTPSLVPNLPNLSTCSNSGIDLQILDKEIGIMDITYSAAWQLGRVLALGNAAYTAALCRLRSAIQGTAMKDVKISTLKDMSPAAFRSREDVLANLPRMVEDLAAVHLNAPGTDPDPGENVPASPRFGAGGPSRRWFRPRLTAADIPSLAFSAPSIEDRYPAAAAEASSLLAQSTDGSLFDETNDPVSTDWMIVCSWLLDRMFLSGVPSHYLITDPCHLQPESLRFFSIDRNWVDALVDGALSLGNHLGDDHDRVAIKTALNSMSAEIPSHGLYFRSDLVTMFPDLKIRVLDENGTEVVPSPILRHEIVTDGVMLVLFDRAPGTSGFKKLTFTQPPHQQRFAVADSLETDEITVSIRRQYTVEQKIRNADPNRHDALTTVVNQPTGDKSNDSIFLWNSQPGSNLNDLRIMRLQRYADLQLQTLQSHMGMYKDGDVEKPYFRDDTATSALMALQLNDPVYSLTISLAQPQTSRTLALLSSPLEDRPQATALAQLLPARVAKTRDLEAREGAQRPGTESESQTEELNLDRNEKYKAGPRLPAPHTKTLPTVDFLATTMPASPLPFLNLAAMVGDANSDPALAPRYDISITSNTSNGGNVIWVDRAANVEQDLVVSVRLTNNRSSQYQLKELDILIKMGPVQSSSSARYYITENYSAGSYFMLTNLRFNVLGAISQDEGVTYLQMRLLPRTAKGWIDATKVSEMSFMLQLVKVNLPWQGTEQPTVDSRAQYTNPAIGWIQNPSTTVTVMNSTT